MSKRTWALRHLSWHVAVRTAALGAAFQQSIVPSAMTHKVRASVTSLGLQLTGREPALVPQLGSEPVDVAGTTLGSKVCAILLVEGAMEAV